MRLLRSFLPVLLSAAALLACGGGNDGADLKSVVSFGDSLSDVGTYKVGTVAAIGGGQFTVNGAGPRNWTEALAVDLQLAAPCPANTGLFPNIPGLTGAASVPRPTCTNYAQGSSRVSGLFAPNSLTLQAAPFNQLTLGMTALPLTQQFAQHLAKVTSYSGTELVTVLAGRNDLFMNVGGLQSAAGGGAAAVGGAIAAGWSTTVQSQVAAGGAAAANAAATAAVTTMGVAGAELAGLIKTQILAKGAKYVVVINLPDVSQTPAFASADAQTRGLVNQMVTTFNSQLAAGLAGTIALQVDLYTQNRDQYANPAQYGVTNVAIPACSTTSTANPLQGSSLGCSAASLITGDTSRYAFADSVHPSPYGHQLIAQFVALQLAKAGWL